MGLQNLSEIARSGELKQEVINAPRSKFDLSRARYFEGMFGAIMPFDVIETLPNEDYEISYDNVIEIRNPLKRKIRNNMRVFFKTYWCKCSDLWAGWDNFVSKGIRQDQSKEIPKYLPYYKYKSNASYIEPFVLSGTDYNARTPFTPMSPLSYMGVPYLMYNSKLQDTTTDRKPIFSARNQSWKVSGVNGTGVFENYKYEGELSDYTAGTKTDTALEINALPLVMYCKIKRLMTNANLTLNNKYWYPDEEDHFRLPYDVGATGIDGDTTKKNWNYVNQVSWSQPLGTYNKWGETTDVTDANSYTSFNLLRNDNVGHACAPHLNALYFAEWKDDYFTGSSPFKDLIRNAEDIPSVSIAEINGSVEFNSVDASWTLNTGNVGAYGMTGSARLATTDGATGNALLEEALNNNEFSADASASLKLMQLRNLIANTLMIERIGTINRPDFYNGYIEAQFGVNPHQNCGDPVYVGGYYQDFMLSDVVNTTADTTKPLGYKVANGMSAGSGYIGKFHSGDYGYLMTVAYVLPEPIYNGGIEKMWRRSTQADLFSPLLQGTAPESIMTWELGLPGASETTVEHDVFGYTKRDESYKWRHNLISGFGATRSSSNFIEDQAYFIKREFTSIASMKLNNDFVTCSPNNCSTDAFTSADEPQFNFSVGCNIKAVRPMMFDAKPSALGYM